METSLEQILNYQHIAVVNRFKKDFPLKAQNAENNFNDLLRFFWASKRHAMEKQASPQNSDLDFIFIMDEEMKDIDHIWHVFLLYTQDYMSFCEKYFGEYLHHLPDVVPKLNYDKKFDAKINLERFLNYVYDNLGEDVVKRWFPVSVSVQLSA